MVLWAALAGLLASGCAGNETPSPEKEQAVLNVVVTTGMLADAVRQIGGERVQVHALMGPGVDPHSYTASQGDIARLRRADLIVYNGLHLEGKMQEVLQNMAQTKPVLSFGEGLDPNRLRKVSSASDALDPHIWFDAALWESGVQALALRMSKQFPQHREPFLAGAARYGETLLALDQELRDVYAAIPQENRVLVTSHDAFEYFGAAYGFEVMGLQGVSTVAEFGLRDMTDMVNLLSERKIPAVFVESSVPHRSLQSVVEGCRQKGHPLVIGGELFSDAMGPEGSPEGTYVGMLRHNAALIAAALGTGGVAGGQSRIDAAAQDQTPATPQRQTP
ncbi:MAG: manganese transporter [Bacteroidetes bacterium]|nr:manganese transporter [Bacteroidota bacterium]